MMQQAKGFLLMEFIAVVTLLSGLLLVVGQWWQHQARLDQRQQWVSHTEYLRLAAERFWLQQGRPPHDFAELQQTLDPETAISPWQQAWRLHSETSLLRLQITAPSEQQARWFAGHFHAATVVGEEITLHQWAPLHEATGEQYLYRVARPDKPELNQLSVNLHMQQHQLTGIGGVVATRANFANLQTETLLVNSASIAQIDTQRLTATQIETPLGDLQQLLDRVNAYELLWLECRNAGGCQ